MFKKLWQWFKGLFRKNRKQVQAKRVETPKAKPAVFVPRFQFVRITAGRNHTVLFDNRLNREIRKPGRWTV